jgi:hypothetical protein
MASVTDQVLTAMFNRTQIKSYPRVEIETIEFFTASNQPSNAYSNN